jgi:hypothetical protein
MVAYGEINGGVVPVRAAPEIGPRLIRSPLPWIYIKKSSIFLF